MGVDVHDASEGAVVVFASDEEASMLSLGSVVASTGCTIWAQPLLVSDHDGEWLKLSADVTREPVQLQGEVEGLLDVDDLYRCRRADPLLSGVRLTHAERDAS